MVMDRVGGSGSLGLGDSKEIGRDLVVPGEARTVSACEEGWMDWTLFLRVSFRRGMRENGTYDNVFLDEELVR